MIDYRAGTWGFHVAFHGLASGCISSLAPRSLVMAIPNALVTFALGTLFLTPGYEQYRSKEISDACKLAAGSFTSIMIFILYNRSRMSYNRWWEGGTLLQKTRGEWFNAYSSIMAFTSTKPEMQEQVDAYTHLLARLMSLLLCCGFQQVSPNRDRPFEIIDLDGIEPESMEFLNGAPDKVEIILQWIQRSMVLHMQTGVLPVAPPILSRAFQEVSRGIVNLQNARKIADFPYPFPLAQVSMMLQLLHFIALPFVGSLAAPRGWAVCFSFFSIFVLWGIHFNALDLEFPFGTRVNDLPMHEMQQAWNKSLCTLLDTRATKPPKFAYESEIHSLLISSMSDASELYVPENQVLDKGVAMIKVKDGGRPKPTAEELEKALAATKHLQESVSSMSTKPGDQAAPKAAAAPAAAPAATPAAAPKASAAPAATPAAAPAAAAAPGTAPPAAAKGPDIPANSAASCWSPIATNSWTIFGAASVEKAPPPKTFEVVVNVGAAPAGGAPGPGPPSSSINPAVQQSSGPGSASRNPGDQVGGSPIKSNGIPGDPLPNIPACQSMIVASI